MNISGLIVTAIIATIGIIKFRLIEELVKKITPDDQKARGLSILFLFIVVVILTIVSLKFDDIPETKNPIEFVSDEKTGPEPQLEPASEKEPKQVTPKTELEVKIDAVKDGIALTDQLVQHAKENKRKKDSTFQAKLDERWVYQIGDWTDDGDQIIETHKNLSMVGNIKLLREKKRYLFIKDDDLTKEQLQSSLDSLKEFLNGTSVKIINLNDFLSRKRNNFTLRTETFGKRKKKVEIPCLVAE